MILLDWKLVPELVTLDCTEGGGGVLDLLKTSP